ncbi:hypothetical protein A4V12_14100 [Streptomyces noursei]|nr:hypothetical protein A4V12_14100 [Streptomyces noursei]
MDGDTGRPGRCRPSPAGRPASEGVTAACRVGPRIAPGPRTAPGPMSVPLPAPEAEAGGEEEGADGEGAEGAPEDASPPGRTSPGPPGSPAGRVSSAYAAGAPHTVDAASSRAATAVAHRESSLGATG